MFAVKTEQQLETGTDAAQVIGMLKMYLVLGDIIVSFWNKYSYWQRLTNGWWKNLFFETINKKKWFLSFFDLCIFFSLISTFHIFMYSQYFTFLILVDLLFKQKKNNNYQM